MTDPVIDLIRSANPRPGTMPALPIEHVQQRLAGARSRPGSRRHVLDVRLGVTAAAVAATLAILLIVAIAATSGGSKPAQQRVGQAEGVGSGERSLVAHLGVLRSAQTATDRSAQLPTPFSRRPGVLSPPSLRLLAQERREGGDPDLQSSLLREITTAQGDEITVAPETYRPSLSSARRVEGLAIAMHTPGNAQRCDTGPRPESVSAFLAHGLGVFNDTRRGVILVPDGVARVELTGFGTVNHQADTKLDDADIAGMSATVHDNAAGFTLANLTATDPSQTGTSTFGGGAQIHMIWFNSAGQVIARPTVDVAVLYVTIRGTAKSSTTQLGSAALRHGSEARFANATGRVSVVSDRGVVGLILTGAGVPDNVRTAYGVWLVNPAGAGEFLGFYGERVQNGKVDLQVKLPADFTRYRDVELTLERTERPRHPGLVVLRGRLP